MKPLTLFVAAVAVVLAGAAAAHAQSIDVQMPMVESEILPRLPNVYRDCWEPLPAHCVRPPGLLWFGNAATLRHERRAFRTRRMHAARLTW
jgi:hypothetical protein